MKKTLSITDSTFYKFGFSICVVFCQRGLLTPQDISDIEEKAEGETSLLMTWHDMTDKSKVFFLWHSADYWHFLCKAIRDNCSTVLERKSAACQTFVGRGLLLIAISLIKHRCASNANPPMKYWHFFFTAGTLRWNGYSRGKWTLRIPKTRTRVKRTTRRMARTRRQRKRNQIPWWSPVGRWSFQRRGRYAKEYLCETEDAKIMHFSFFWQKMYFLQFQFSQMPKTGVKKLCETVLMKEL